MLPMRALHGGSRESALFSTWECLVCPHAVRQVQNYPDWYSLLVHHNDKWYELSQTYGSQTGPLLTIYLISIEEQDDSDTTYWIQSEKILERKMDAGLTPQNVESKLPTILVFS
jgi:hypothetical protein